LYCSKPPTPKLLRPTAGPNKPSFWIPCLGESGEQIRHFLMFEGVSVLLAMASYMTVYRRQRRLDFRLMEKVNRQIGAGV